MTAVFWRIFALVSPEGGQNPKKSSKKSKTYHGTLPCTPKPSLCVFSQQKTALWSLLTTEDSLVSSQGTRQPCRVCSQHKRLVSFLDRQHVCSQNTTAGVPNSHISTLALSPGPRGVDTISSQYDLFGEIITRAQDHLIEVDFQHFKPLP